MADINFNCTHCGQNLNAPEEMAGQVVECPVCQKSFQIPGGIIEMPKGRLTPPDRPSAPARGAAPSGSDDKGKTVRIELPPEFLAEPEKHIFKIKRMQH